ncbi:LysM peptidoglycan-binding domain-containing protein [Roseobacter sp. CCS2]|uniref:LysM peptidoglycan-binding domain-containing protein n=1 Tax=Roseobacter sp. CCS2 TaxID=391593 RepID=UPI0000F40353|nr:transporter substrate-binding domain-containing protein [Roseobacter sp. CCS2]EBA14042.1 LysM domain protein [Roseobacter sp. CCS2]
MRNLTVLLAGSAVSLFATSATAQEIACDTVYTVEAGDFLSGIAQRAYGNLNNFSVIYDANRDVIGPNPGIIRIGQEFYIPCLNGSGAAARVTAASATSGSGENAPIRVLTASGWRPFLDESDPQGGLLTEITELALVNTDDQADYEIDFINDFGAHLDPLLTKQAYDVSIGQLQPACADGAQLGPESTFLCDNFDFSDPLYEEIFGYYSAAGDPEYTDHQELSGKTICRAVDYTLVPLEAVNLSQSAIDIVRAPDAATCIDYVLDGNADVALVAIEVADARIKELDAQDNIQLHDDLSYIDFFHATVAKNNPRGDDILGTINSGLKNIKESGLWFQTVRRHMIEFRQSGS